MPFFLGIDTSNYTTSVAIFDNKSQQIFMRKKLLPTKDNSLGLRQSDAVFAHVRQLSDLIFDLMESQDCTLSAVCVSTKPRNDEASYMPCFLVGKMVAKAISSVLKIPCYECSHQQGHVMAALFSANQIKLLKQDFFAFHVSGGTTEALLITPQGKLFDEKIIGKSLDLHAGQLIDRVGVMLDLKFPCGKELTDLAISCNEKIKIIPAMKGIDVNLSGEQNRCEKFFKDGKPREYIARYAIESVKFALDKMVEEIFLQYGKKPIVFAGGVMSNVIIREFMQEKYGAFFAQPQFSTDNAAGVSIIASTLYDL